MNRARHYNSNTGMARHTSKPTSNKAMSILTISLARHLVGHDISVVLDRQWSDPKVSLSISSQFDNVGFNLDPKSPEDNIAQLKKVLQERHWDGLLLGWCVRGHAEFTEFFEAVVAACVEECIRRDRIDSTKPRLVFCTGPDDVVNATLRNFPVDAVDTVAV